jgi:hypothetical protein
LIAMIWFMWWMVVTLRWSKMNGKIEFDFLDVLMITFVSLVVLITLIGVMHHGV